MEIAEQYPNGAIRPLSVGMHTAEKKVDSEVGNQHTQECGCAVPVERLRGSKKPQGTGVQRGRIHDNRNQGPHLLWIPGPVVPALQEKSRVRPIYPSLR